MWVAGVRIPASALAELAFRLHKAGHTDLAQRLGTAVDTNRAHVALSSRERGSALSVLEECPENLVDLRQALQHEEVSHLRRSADRQGDQLPRVAE